MNPLTKISELIAEMEGTRPKPWRVHLRRLRIRAAIAYRRQAWDIVGLLGITGMITFLLGLFQFEDAVVPVLTGLLQWGTATALAWEQMQFESGD